MPKVITGETLHLGICIAKLLSQTNPKSKFSNLSIEKQKNYNEVAKNLAKQTKKQTQNLTTSNDKPNPKPKTKRTITAYSLWKKDMKPAKVTKQMFNTLSDADKYNYEIKAKKMN